MTPQEAARRTRVLRQTAAELLRLIQAPERDAAKLLKAADKLGEDYHLTLRAAMELAYDEAAGVTVGNEAFSARIYGVGVDGK